MSADWALNVADQIMGDIPRSVHSDWADELPDRAAELLRFELVARSSDARISTMVEEIVRALPGYLPAISVARMRAKLTGALLAAGALGEHFTDSGEFAALEPQPSGADR